MITSDQDFEAHAHPPPHPLRRLRHAPSIDEGKRFKVKRITVKPGEKLSLQMHHHRAEHWGVVSGTAMVRNDDIVRFADRYGRTDSALSACQAHDDRPLHLEP